MREIKHSWIMAAKRWSFADVWRGRIVIGVMLSIFQQFVGINVVLY
ncbi:MFS transporter [Escherichia coli]